jgi:hypothetical protein
VYASGIQYHTFYVGIQKPLLLAACKWDFLHNIPSPCYWFSLATQTARIRPHCAPRYYYNTDERRWRRATLTKSYGTTEAMPPQCCYGISFAAR